MSNHNYSDEKIEVIDPMMIYIKEMIILIKIHLKTIKI